MKYTDLEEAIYKLEFSVTTKENCLLYSEEAEAILDELARLRERLECLGECNMGEDA